MIMDKKDSDLLEKIRQQFNNLPYPRNPLERSPDSEVLCLYEHNILNAYYLRDKTIIESEGKVLLDAGCGSGYTTLALAQANPGARIIGIDISEGSVDFAKKRLEYYGFKEAEFYAMPIEELSEIEKEFDYINCDEVLYLMPDPILGLQAMKSVLKPSGIIRANLHSSLQRVHYFRAQEMFKMMGLMDGNPPELETEIVWETMRALKNQVLLKQRTWSSKFDEDKEVALLNHLLQGDKGYTILEMFSALEAVGLEFISMVNWRKWELMDLFEEPDNLPVFLGLSLPEISIEQRLHMYELLNPVHRLLDFWCGHPEQAQAYVPVTEWTTSQWQQAKIHLHPQLKTEAVKAELVRCITHLHPFEINQYLPIADKQVSLDSALTACLFPPLLDSAQSMPSLVERWQKLQPVHPITLKATTQDEAFEVVRQALMGLENLGYVLLDH